MSSWCPRGGALGLARLNGSCYGRLPAVNILQFTVWPARQRWLTALKADLTFPAHPYSHIPPHRADGPLAECQSCSLGREASRLCCCRWCFSTATDLEPVEAREKRTLPFCHLSAGRMTKMRAGFARVSRVKPLYGWQKGPSNPSSPLFPTPLCSSLQRLQ